MKKSLMLFIMMTSLIILSSCQKATEPGETVEPESAPSASESLGGDDGAEIEEQVDEPAPEAPTPAPTTDPSSEPVAETVVEPTPEPEPEPTPEPDPEPETAVPVVKSFSMTAKQWSFSPSTITVNEGDTVRLSITSTDVNHGFSLRQFGVSANLQPGKTVQVEFVADKKGTFTFLCNVVCGSGHGSMKGSLVVK